MSDTAGGAIYVLNEASGELYLEAGHNMTEEHLAAVREHPIHRGEPVVGECVDRGEAVQVADLAADPRDFPLFAMLQRAGFRALLAVPLLYQGRAIGVADRAPPAARRLLPDVVNLLQSFASPVRRLPSRTPGCSTKSRTRAGSFEEQASTSRSSLPI